MSARLTSDNIYLRPPRADDAQAMVEAARESAVEVGHWLPWCHAEYKLEEARAWIAACEKNWEQADGYPFYIFDRRTHQLLGGCGLNELDRHRMRANLGYWVRTSRMGEGIATAAAKATAEFGLKQLGFQRLEIVAALGNTGSQRVAEKVGAQREGIARNRLRIRSVPHDAVVFSIIPADLA
jgi:RimJ/RimL family protein N-acetyltransferase